MPYWLYIGGILFVIVELIESIGALAFWPLAYSIGPRIFSASSPDMKPPPYGLEQVVETRHGKFKLVSNDRVLFRSRQHDVRGVIDWRSGTALAVARFSLAHTLVLASVAAGVVSLLVVGRDLPKDVMLGPLVGLLLLVVLTTVLVAIQRNRMRRLLEEYLALGNGSTATRLTSASS